MTTKSPSSVEPEMPVCATITQWRPMTTLCPICTRLSIFVPSPMIVSLSRGRAAHLCSGRNVLRGMTRARNLGTSADLNMCSPVDRGVSPDLHVVLDDHPSNLRHLQVAARAHSESEAVLPDARTRMHDDTVADQSMNQSGERPYVTIAPDANAVSDYRACGNACPTADPRLRPDSHAAVASGDGAGSHGKAPSWSRPRSATRCVKRSSRLTSVYEITT